jgi:hypothetical protein
MGKRRFASVLGIFLALSVSLGALAAPADPAIVIARVAGTVEISHPKQTAGKWQAAKQGGTIGRGWKLRTAKGGKVQLTFPKNNTVILKENSVLYVDKLDGGGGGKLLTDKGGFLFELKNALSPGSKFEVDTPAALATVRGTEFAVLLGDVKDNPKERWELASVAEEGGRHTPFHNKSAGGGVGQPGDPYEQHADQIADRGSAGDSGFIKIRDTDSSPEDGLELFPIGDHDEDGREDYLVRFIGKDFYREGQEAGGFRHIGNWEQATRGSIILEADLDGDGEFEQLTGIAAGDLDGDGTADYVVGSKVAIKTRGTGADKNRALPAGGEGDKEWFEILVSHDVDLNGLDTIRGDVDGDGAPENLDAQLVDDLDGDGRPDVLVLVFSEENQKSGLQDKKNKRMINADAKLDASAEGATPRSGSLSVSIEGVAKAGLRTIPDSDSDGEIDSLDPDADGDGLSELIVGDLDGDGDLERAFRVGDTDVEGINDWNVGDWFIFSGFSNGDIPQQERKASHDIAMNSIRNIKAIIANPGAGGEPGGGAAPSEEGVIPVPWVPANPTIPHETYGGRMASVFEDGTFEIISLLNHLGVGAGERKGASTRDSDGLVFNLVNPSAARDNHLQGAVDVLMLALDKNNDGLINASDPIWEKISDYDTNRDDSFDTAEMADLLGKATVLDGTVSMDDQSVSSFNWKQVSGPFKFSSAGGDLIAATPQELREGGVNDTTHQLQGAVKWPPVKLHGYEGEVAVSNDLGTELLHPGETITASGDGPPSPPQPSGPEAEQFRNELKEQFQTGDVPTEEQFGNLIDSAAGDQKSGITIHFNPKEYTIKKLTPIQQLAQLEVQAALLQGRAGADPGGLSGSELDKYQQEQLAAQNKLADELAEQLAQVLEACQQIAQQEKAAAESADPTGILIGLLEEIEQALRVMSGNINNGNNENWDFARSFNTRAISTSQDFEKNTEGVAGGLSSSAEGVPHRIIWDSRSEIVADFAAWSDLLNGLARTRKQVSATKWANIVLKRGATTAPLPDLSDFDGRLDELLAQAKELHTAAHELAHVVQQRTDLSNQPGSGTGTPVFGVAPSGGGIQQEHVYQHNQTDLEFIEQELDPILGGTLDVTNAALALAEEEQQAVAAFKGELAGIEPGFDAPDPAQILIGLLEEIEGALDGLQDSAAKARQENADLRTQLGDRARAAGGGGNNQNWDFGGQLLNAIEDFEKNTEGVSGGFGLVEPDEDTVGGGEGADRVEYNINAPASGHSQGGTTGPPFAHFDKWSELLNTLHAILDTYLGAPGQSMVEDRTFDDEVWTEDWSEFEQRLTAIDGQLADVTSQLESLSEDNPVELVLLLPYLEEAAVALQATQDDFLPAVQRYATAYALYSTQKGARLVGSGDDFDPILELLGADGTRAQSDGGKYIVTSVQHAFESALEAAGGERWDQDPYSEDVLRLLSHFVAVFDLVAALDTQASEVTVRGWDPARKQEIVGLAQQLERISDEWERYEANDQVTQMKFLWVQILGLHDPLHDLYEDFGDAVGLKVKEKANRTKCSNNLRTLPPVPFDTSQGELLPASVELPAVQSLLLPAVQSLLLPAVQSWLEDVVATGEEIRALHERMVEMQDEISPLISSNEELQDQLRGLIDPGDPVLGTRWENIDTDNDGMSDVAEIALGLDPLASNDDGFIELVEPDDAALFHRAADDSIDFAFEPLDTDEDVTYALILSSGGQQLTRQNVREHERIQMDQLVGPGGTFQDDDGDGGIEVEWYVEGRYLLRAGVPVRFESERRSFTIELPAAQSVIIDLDNASAFQRVGGEIVVRGSISEVSDLGEWEISVAFDPSVLQFERGRKLGIFSPATVFFGEQAGGVVVISGSAPRTGGGINGEGEIFELVFTALAAEDTVVEGDDARLTDTVGQDIETDFGNEADISISGGGAAGVGRMDDGSADGRLR